MIKRVWIISKSSHDFEPAKEFGELKFITPQRVFSRYDVNNIHRLLFDKLQYSDPEDYLILTGLPIMQALACSIMTKLHGKLNLLVFKTDKKTKRKFYVERNLVL